MSRQQTAALLVLAWVVISSPVLQVSLARAARLITSVDSSGRIASYQFDRAGDRSNPFFDRLGNNGRSCATCHDPREGWPITPLRIQARFRRSRGRDPLFRLIDGATRPSDDVSTPSAMLAAYSPLLHKGLIRVPRSIRRNRVFGYQRGRSVRLHFSPEPHHWRPVAVSPPSAGDEPALRHRPDVGRTRARPRQSGDRRDAGASPIASGFCRA